MNNQGVRRGQGPGGAVGVLHVVGGNDRGKQYQMVNPTTQIGRGADQDFVLADIAVSRRHVQILIDGTRYRMRDLGSGNGTLINGVRTATALLNDGDQIEIGNTQMRFDHPPSSTRASSMSAPALAPVPQAQPAQRTMIAEAPSGYGAPPPAYAPPQQPFPVETPSDVRMPRGTMSQMVAPSVPMHAPPSYSQRANAPLPPRGGGLLDSTAKKVAVFGTIGLVLTLGAGAAVLRMRGGGDTKEQADKTYAEAKKAFAAGDYDAALTLFSTAATLDPQNQLIPKQQKQCEAEIKARAALKQAVALGSQSKWDEEFKMLDSVDKSTASWDEAEKVRKQAQPEAIKAWLAEARDDLASDADTARQRVEAVLVIDPDNADAKELAEKLKGPEVAAGKSARPRRTGSSDEAPPRPHVVEPASPPTTAARPAAAGSSGSGFKPIEDDEDDGAGAGGGAVPADVLSLPAAAGPYRAKDFAGAANALRSASKTLRGAGAQKALSLAAQVQRLGESYGKAEAAKATNPATAVSEYQAAMGIDASVGKGTHAAYFKGQASKLVKDAARQAFGQQKFDTAFEMTKLAQRLGGDDGGVGAQLKQKAGELNGKAAAMAKSNASGAKTLWRMVMRMVPASDPAYQAATKGLASTSGSGKDEDED